MVTDEVGGAIIMSWDTSRAFSLKMVAIIRSYTTQLLAKDGLCLDQDVVIYILLLRLFTLAKDRTLSPIFFPMQPAIVNLYNFNSHAS